MRIQRLRMPAGIVALCLVSSVALAVSGVSGTTALGAATTLTVLSGDVEVRHAGATTFAPAADGDVVNAGDEIRTGERSRAVLTYFEGSTVTLEPSTVLLVESAESRSGGTVVRMLQLAGRTWHVVTKLASPGSRYEVETPASTASVRGTEFEVSVVMAETTITTAEGAVMALVDARSQGRDIVSVPVTAGMTQTQRRDAPPAPATPSERHERTSVVIPSPTGFVVDPLGRTNGVTRDGRLVAQTPGVRVERDGNDLRVTIDDPVPGKMRVRDGRSGSRDRGVELARDAAGRVKVRALAESELDGAPWGKLTPSGHAVPRAQREDRGRQRD